MAMPQSPTLLTPGNLEHASPDPSQAFTWLFQDPDPGDTQGSYALRRKVAGAGAYSFWNGAAWVTDANAPVLNSDGSIRLYGVATNRGARMKNAAAMQIVGDIEFVARVNAQDWTPGAVTVLGSTLVAATSGYEFYIDTTGKLGLKVVKSGPTELTAISSVAATTVDATSYWVKMTRASATGNCNFYTAADAATEPSGWTQVGTANVASTIGAILTPTADLWLGQRPNGTLMFNGKIFRVLLRSAIGGAAVVDFDAARCQPSALGFYGSTGEAWSLIFCPYNTTAVQNVSITLANWPSRVTYQWSIATQDAAGNASPFATDRVLVSTKVPVVTVPAPTGSQTTSRPTVTWTYSQEDAFPQSEYQVKIYSAAQYGAGGFSADTSLATWESGWIVSSTAWSKLIEFDLANGVSYRAYVQVKESGSLKSAWIYSSFSMNLALATAPTITRTLEPTLGRAKVQIKADFNLLTDEQADLEGGTTTGWLPTNNCALSNVNTQSSGGSLRSMKITASGQTYNQLDGNYAVYTNEDTAFADFTAQTASMA